MSFARTTRAIDRLVTLGASTTQPDRWGSTPMQSLAKAGAALAEHLALRHGVKVDAVSQVRLGQVPEDVSDPNLLAAAVESGREDLVRTLVERGASPDASEALHKAAWRGDAAMARLLIALGASVRLRDGQHDATPLDWAETSLAITGNEACRGVIEYLQTQ
ncbi:MAG: ankyrin repeat domain-containing protein [Acidobacteria bacterium]|nr:ankyrin repeat domain-containing protein [Acidobacteriota bacterium]